jgi:hypothetical protein
VLVILVALAPYIISTRLVTDLVVYVINSRIRGRISIDDIAIGWTGPSRIRGLSVTDPQGREVLRAENISLAGGMWRLIVAREDFDELEVASTRLELRVTPEGKITLAEALSSRERDRKKRKRDQLPEPVGKVLLRDSSVAVVLPSGRRYDLSGVNGRIDLNTLNDVAGNVQARLPEGGALLAEFAVSGMAEGDKLEPDLASGSLSLRTLEAVELQPIGEFAGMAVPLGGKADLTIDAKFRRGEAEGKFDLAVAKLEAAGEKYMNIRPVDLRLAGSTNFSGDKLAGKVDLTGPGSTLGAGFEYLVSREPFELSWETLLAAAIDGEPISLPDFTLALNGRLGFGRLGQAVPSLLNIRPDVSVTDGTLNIDGVALRGGAQPGARGSIALVNVKAVRAGRTISWQPVTARFDVTIARGEGLRIRETELEASFGQLTAGGTASNLRVECASDLEALREQLGEIFDLGDLVLVGDVAGALDLARRSEQQADVAFVASAKNLLYEQGRRKLNLSAASFSGSGRLGWKNRGNFKLTETKARLHVPDELALDGSGWIDLSGKSFDLNVSVLRAALAGLARNAEGLGYDQAVGYSGDLEGSARVSRSSVEAPVTTSGSLSARDLRHNGELLSARPVRLDWSGVEVAGREWRFSAARASLLSGPANVTLSDVSGHLREDFVLHGAVEAAADVGLCVEVYRKIRPAGEKADERKLPELAGRLTWAGKARTEAGIVSFDGKGAVADFQIGSGPKAVREREVRFDQAVSIDHGRELVTVRKFSVVSEPLTVVLDEGGTIRQFKTSKILNITGRYEGDWQRLTAVLHELVPATAEYVEIRGPAVGSFSLTGPAEQPTLRPTYRGLRADSVVPWSGILLSGFRLGGARLLPELADGRFVLPSTTVEEIDSAGRPTGGKVRLGAVMDVGADEPTLELDGEMVILEGLRITPEVGRKLLSRFNPIFAGLASLDGSVTLATDKKILLHFPREGTVHGSGSGRLDLSGVRVRPAGLVAELLLLVGLGGGETRIIQIGSLDFKIKHDRVEYEDFLVKFGDQLDLRFKGSVGFDDTVDLSVSIPVRAAILERVGVKGPILDYARLLEGMRVDLPIKGTRFKPDIGFPRDVIQRLVQRAVELLLKEEARKQLEGLIKSPPEQPRKPPAEPPPTKSEEMLLDAIFDILEKISKQKQEPKN